MAVAWLFGDGFDAYRSDLSEAILGYWDSGTSVNATLGGFNSGRFSGSKCLVAQTGSGTVGALVKSSGSNDTTHHISCAIKMTTSGSVTGFWFTLFDGTTAQCTVIFKNNGDIVLTSGLSTGSTLATYSTAVTADATWFYFEIEVVVNNATGSIKVRKNGNTSDDFSSTGLNTRGGTANNYANKLSVGCGNASAIQRLDDLLWRSDATVAWVGDIRCLTRFAAADSSVQFTPSSATCALTPYVATTTATITAGRGYYLPFIATTGGTVGTAVVSLAAAITGNLKCTIFNDSAGVPGTALGSATALTNPTAGNNTFTFGSPPTVVAGTLYWMGFDSDVSTTSAANALTSVTTDAYVNQGLTSTTAYASFPAASPSTSASHICPVFTVNITPTSATNAMLVGEVATDDATTYVSDSTVNHADLYTPSAISVTPTTVVATITRALCQKTDAGTRNIAVQVKSGSTTSTGTSTALNTTWAWIFKVDQVDPDTSAAWTATGVNNATFGPKLTA